MVNKARSLDEAVSVFSNLSEVTLSRSLGRLEYAGFIPRDEKLQQATRLSKPVESLFPESPAACAYRRIALDLCNWSYLSKESGGLERFVRQLLDLSRQIDPVAIYA